MQEDAYVFIQLIAPQTSITFDTQISGICVAKHLNTGVTTPLSH